ncbi:phage tail sheath C-terminal domain-containing protein [Petroclostridium xylanilyticum]|uniref:phage tail sheath C-terminal domain-containing protein n=1 Tax=Petroclostridium xylanilyticum TaxID=1792311 RepID=UPI000B97E850|nr:phage tail sheath C-terminal domain-containing protein [Petroclostridium xylanilyticum]
MAGTFTTQNKVRPGVYINFSTEAPLAIELSDRGIVALPLSLSWGPVGSIIEVNQGESTFSKLGYELSDPKLLLLREALKRAQKALVYRINDGAAATATLAANITATAKHKGARGNDITVRITENGAAWDVETLVSGKSVDVQTGLTDVSDFIANDWISITGTGMFEATTQTLTGGADDNSTLGHAGFLAALQVQDYNTIACFSTNSADQALYINHVASERANNGKMVQCVMADNAADKEYIISVKNGVKLSDGTLLTAAQACAWVAGATAAAKVNQSLTFTKYEDAVDANPRLTNAETEAAITAGHMVFTAKNGYAVLEYDINSLTSFAPPKSKAWRSNRVMRVLDAFQNDVQEIFEAQYVGKINNNEDGRQLLRAAIIQYCNELQSIGVLQNFEGADDVAVSAGTDPDAVVVEANLQPVDSVNKIYIKVNVR